MMTEAVGENRSYLIITMRISKRAVTRNHVVGELAAGGNRPRFITTTRRSTRAVTRNHIGFLAWHGEIISSR